MFIGKADDSIEVLSELYDRRFPNAITWTLHNNVWEHKDEVMSPVTLVLPANGSSVDFRVSLINRKGELSLKVRMDSDEPQTLPLTIKVWRRKDGLLRLNSTMYWIWDTSKEVIFYIVRMLDLKYVYPFDITVLLEKTQTSPRQSCPGELFNDKLVDAKLTVGDYSVKVHKSVLAEKSEFFSNMFGKECPIKEYSIDGVSKYTLEKLVSYMYKHSLPTDVDLTLLRGAHKFQLEDLVEHIESTLRTQITIGNALEMYAAVEQLCLDQLGNSVKNFIKRHADEIVLTGKLRKFQNHPGLLKELFLEVCQRPTNPADPADSVLT